jgi:phage portal protein BeeE
VVSDLTASDLQQIKDMVGMVGTTYTENKRQRIRSKLQVVIAMKLLDLKNDMMSDELIKYQNTERVTLR